MIVQIFVLLSCFELFSGAIFAQDMLSLSKDGFTDASVVTWAHAVNSHQALEAELEGQVDFLEADVSLGHVSGNEVGPPIPIMAHPPKVTSDISLERWLDIVIARQSNKGIKLDFKSIDIVEPSLQILQRHKGKLQFPLWLNADILPGPMNLHTTPVLAEKFLALCEEYFPNATLSVGWTTYWLPGYAMKNGYYNWNHVRKMADTLKCFSNTDNTPVTFPVRGIFASRSIRQLQWLTEVFPHSTLTVWTGKPDNLKLKDLMIIRESFPKSRVFYDIPDKIGLQFREKKDEIEVEPSLEPTFIEKSYVKMTKSHPVETSTCFSDTYITSKTVMFGKGMETFILLKEIFVVTESTPLKAQGQVVFFGNESSASSHEDPQLILALAEVRSFSKNFSALIESKSDDSKDELWSTMNSSQLHVFKPEKSSQLPSCHSFLLDTTSNKPFQAWTIDCDQMREDQTTALNLGKSEVSSRKRLILPDGPFVFGIISSGGGHVVIDDLMVKGIQSSSNSGVSSSKYFKGLFVCILIACVTLAYTFSTDIYSGPTLWA